jgi:hypothetical protein
LPANGAAPGADGIPPPNVNQTRGRSDSDPNDAPVSLLQRISAKRNQEVATATVETTYQPPSRPRTGSLRVDTSSLDQPSLKQQQNKSAYPSFTTKGGLFSQPNESSGGLSPGPVTAGPDLGSRQFINFAQVCLWVLFLAILYTHLCFEGRKAGCRANRWSKRSPLLQWH